MSTQEWGVRPVQSVIRVFFNTLHRPFDTADYL
jgi:hypothetical protein